MEAARASPTFRSESPLPKFKTSSHRSKSPPQIPRTTVEAVANVFSGGKSTRRSSPLPRTVSPVEPRKFERPESPVPNQKHPVVKVSSQSPKKSPPRKKSPEPNSPPRPASEPIDQAKSIVEERRPPQLLAGNKHSLFDSTDSDSSTSSLSKFEGEGLNGGHALFKEKKASRKSRHYRERVSSRSPDVCISSSTGDVDLRQCGPPQKLARLATFQADVTMAPTSIAKEEAKSPSIEAAAKDVDLRQLPGTPGKKRPSLDGSDQPQVKKSKAEMLDALFGFGGEDVDLRQLPATAVSLPAPPPCSSPGHEKVDEQPDRDDRAKENEPHPHDKDAANTEGWAKYKELKPDAFKSPRPFGALNRDVRDKQPQELPSSGPGQPPMCDKLGRPLLYTDEGKRRTSASSSLSPLPETDTDMRQPSLLARDALDSMERGFNFDLIVAQADEQLKSGTLSSTEYNKLLQQMIQLNETHKLREAQRRDEQEKLTWEEMRRRRKKRFENGSKIVDDASPVSSPESFHEDVVDDQPQSTEYMSPPTSRFGDIDERFQSVAKMRLPPAAPAPTPGSIARTAPIQQQWAAEMSPLPASGPSHPPPRWDTPPTPGSWHTAASVSHPPPPRLGPPLHLLPPAGYHRPPAPAPASGPEFSSPSPGGYGLSRWRSPFPSRPFDTDADSRFDRYGGRGSGVPGRFPRLSLHSQMMQHPPPSLPPLHSQELPPADPVILDLIAQDAMRTIAIDSVPRNIRFYGDTAVVILTWDNPREISFQPGTRRITFDDRESFICSFNAGYRDIILDGSKHRIRLGAPTRELYIDGKWYECFFGGPSVKVELNGKLWSVKLDGPAPQVRIGVIRLDLVAGKVNLIIDARTIVPIFLDAKPQRFDIEGVPHILRFADALRTVLINGQPLDVEFGGLPKPIIVGGKKHFVRLSMLPEGVVPGYAKIVSMEGGCLPSPPHVADEDSNSMGFTDESSNDTAQYNQGHKPALPIFRNVGEGRGRHVLRRRHDKDQGGSSPGRFLADREGSAVGSAAPPHSHLPHRSRPTGQLPLELLTSLMPGTLSASAPACSYQVEQESQDSHKPTKEGPDTPAAGAAEVLAVAVGKSTGVAFTPVINVEELFKKLVATGIVPTGIAAPPENQATETKKEEVNAIKEVDLKQSEMLKIRQPALITVLYSGIQCSSCGVRFSPEQTMKYSQHLDWHFRQNRRDRDNTRKAQSRKWYYDVSDWIQFEEIEDLEERAQSWFEVMQAAEGRPDEEEQEIPSVPAGESLEDTCCDVCHEKFEQFYSEETEEWHLRLATRVDGKTYHPICYDDYKASLEKTADESSAMEDVKEEGGEAATEETAVVKEEEEKEAAKAEVEDDEVIVLEDSRPEQVKAEGAAEPGAAEEQMAEPKEESSEVKEESGEAKEESAEPKEESAEHEEVTAKEESPMEPGETEETEAVTEKIAAIKLEPPDSEEEPEQGVIPDITVKEEPQEEEEVKPAPPVADTTLVSVACSIDGNVQFEEQLQVATAVPGKIKINITKPITAKETSTDAEAEQAKDEAKESASSIEKADDVKEAALGEEQTEMTEPPPPGVGPEPVHMKPLLVGRKLTELPKVQKGKELSALCSIM